MPSARGAALRALAQRRLTAAQLAAKLQRKGFDDAAVEAAIASCKRDGLLDDGLFALLYVEGRRGAVGDARLVAELVKRGIDRDEARSRVSTSASPEDERIGLAYDRLRKAKPDLSYQSAARRLERLGFPASLIYRLLRERAGVDLAETAGEASSF